MKCPYNPAKIVQDSPGVPVFTQHDYQDASAGEATMVAYYHPSTQTTQYIRYDCLQEECAAWQNNACVRIKAEVLKDG